MTTIMITMTTTITPPETPPATAPATGETEVTGAFITALGAKIETLHLLKDEA